MNRNCSFVRVTRARVEGFWLDINALVEHGRGTHPAFTVMMIGFSRVLRTITKMYD